MKLLFESFFLVLLFLSAVSGEAKPETFTGEIADSSCAYNVHSLTRSHKQMLKSKEWGNTAADCTRKCVRQFGASYVLVHKNEVYKLEQQNLADRFAGQTVKIVGSLDGDGKKIHIDSIAASK